MRYQRLGDSEAFGGLKESGPCIDEASKAMQEALEAAVSLGRGSAGNIGDSE